ncbi:MAG: MauE/DoxX family redox-associated membrane protein [Polymorphobacter sp.]|uniref:MauE/DoxX family redox-associated membrane protein n=1 Tax=Polymorphobacter sp. TaxID=1909290 RepID=UPI003A860A78
MTAALALFLALLLGVSAAHKVIARSAMAPIAARLAGASAGLGAALLLAAATVEGLAAVALLAQPLRTLGALLAALLWLAYAAALWRRHGERLDCGCDLTRRETPVGATAIARPLLLALLAAVVVLSPPAAVTIDTPFAALALLALWFAAAELSALPALSRTAR